MNEIFIGEYIKSQRKRMGLSQKALCEGICEPVTISRLENGKQTPSRKVVNALLQRLDLPADRYFALLNDHETKLENVQAEVVALNIKYERVVDEDRMEIRNRAYGKLRELADLAEEDDRITRQFILRSKVLLGKEDGTRYSPDEKLGMLMEAIRMTVPKFRLDQIGSFLYCLDEIIILNQISGVYTMAGEHKKAADILGQLLLYLKNHCQNIIQYRGHLPMIAHNYARVLNLCGENEKALETAEEARQACIKFKNYQMLPRILHVMAVTHHDLGNHAKSRQLYRQAYWVSRAVDDDRDIANLQADAREHYGMELRDES